MSALADLMGDADGGSGQLPARAKRSKASKYLDAYHWADGSLILCAACLIPKEKSDPSVPEETMWWNHHGRPDNPTSHSQICMYCETDHTKRKFEMTAAEYNVYAQTEEGKADREHITEKLIEFRRRRSESNRLSKKQVCVWGEEASKKRASIKRSREEMYDINQPKENWIPASTYEEDHGCTPESNGISCTWEVRNGVKEFGFWQQTDEPMTRQRKTRQSLKFEEEVDDNDLEIEDGDIARRFEAEKASMLREQPAGHKAEIPQRASQRPAPLADKAPLGKSLLSQTLSVGSSANSKRGASAPHASDSTPKKPRTPGGALPSSFGGGGGASPRTPSASPPPAPKASRGGGCHLEQKPESTPRGNGPIPTVQKLECINECEQASCS